jgi:hypothetical protein
MLLRHAQGLLQRTVHLAACMLGWLLLLLLLLLERLAVHVALARRPGRSTATGCLADTNSEADVWRCGGCCLARGGHASWGPSTRIAWLLGRLLPLHTSKLCPLLHCMHPATHGRVSACTRCCLLLLLLVSSKGVAAVHPRVTR